MRDETNAPEAIAWRRIEDAMRKVLDRPPAERESALHDACGEDRELRREVESLLDAEAASGSFMARSAVEEAAFAGIQPAAPVRELGLEIPGYRILDQIGAGGMGAVYLSERDDGHFQHRVAIKVLRRDVVDESVRKRFLQERQILAWLTHRNIATLLDGGLAADATPYLVMEYVDGRPIQRYCDECRLGIDDRLRLFLQVCRGVGHAHRNGVVHRDLKPSNILVSQDAEVKLLDFGIAKILERDAAAIMADLPVTRTAEVVLTPLYASPEQLRGEAVGPAADVFSLGVVLYELLTGRHPFATDAWSVGETERAIIDLDAEHPSAVVSRIQDVAGPDGRRMRVHPDVVGAARGTSAGRLRAALRGDLDAVVLRALSKQPGHRYRDADALGRDVELHLAGRPIVARAGSPLARARAWGRRRLRTRRGATDVSSWSIREAGRQARRADAMMNFLARMFELAAPSASGRPTITAREMLDWAAEHAEGELAGEPEARADIMTTLGRIFHEIGDDTGAIRILERSLEEQRRLYGAEDPRLLSALKWLATAHQDQAEHETAETYFREALAITRAVHGERHLEVSSRLNDLAVVLDRLGRLSESKSLYEEALAIKRENLAEDDPQVITNINNLAVLLQRMGHSRQAEHLLRQVLSARRRTYGNESIYVANALNNLMIAHRRRGDHAGAEPLARQALALRRRLLGADHPDVALSLFNLGCVVRDLGREDEAEPMLVEAFEIAKRARGEDHPDVAGMVNALATLKRRQGDHAGAEKLTRRALATMEAKLDPRNPQLANVQFELGLNLLEQGRAAEAEPWLRGVVSARLDRVGEESPMTAEARAMLGRCWQVLGRDREAGELLRAAEPVLRSAWGDTHPVTRLVEEGLGEVGGGAA